MIKVSQNGSLLYSTFIGGENTDNFWSISISSINNIFIAGSTLSNNLSSPNIKNNLKSEDSIIIMFSPEGNLLQSLYYGGSRYDEARCILTDKDNDVTIVGYTSSSDFPVNNGYQVNNSGLYDMFITKIDSTYFNQNSLTQNSLQNISSRNIKPIEQNSF